MKSRISKIITNSDFIDLKKLETVSTDSLCNETKIVIIPHAYRDETLELIALEHYTDVSACYH